MSMPQQLPMDASASLYLSNPDSPYCVICRDDQIEQGDRWVSHNAAANERDLKVQHTFHKNCLAPWLSVNTTCPTCREPLNITQILSTKEKIVRFVSILFLKIVPLFLVSYGLPKTVEWITSSVDLGIFSPVLTYGSVYITNLICLPITVKLAIQSGFIGLLLNVLDSLSETQRAVFNTMTVTVLIGGMVANNAYYAASLVNYLFS
ncbi:hypothetical protein [Simkania sp.]|uniref:hypothetical protein n=1 Tax=Simkania sp. TaxID=34094 RepID=UPI003B5246CB